MTTIALTNKILSYWFTDNSYYTIKCENKFKKLFFSFIYGNIILIPPDDNTNEPTQIQPSFNIYDIQEQNAVMNNKQLNIMLCVENCNCWPYFEHFNKYGSYGNKQIQIYIYNHIDKYVETTEYIALPIIYLQVDYYTKYKNVIKPRITTLFENKKFCLIVSFNRTPNCKLNNIIDKIKKIGTCDSIKNIPHLKTTSCYHESSLLTVFNEYKFILCFENSFSDGYITEKIFNVFFAKTIPLYLGPSDKYRYFNQNSFINLEDDENQTLGLIHQLATNKELYYSFIQNEKINCNFDNENYSKKANRFINLRL